MNSGNLALWAVGGLLLWLLLKKEPGASSGPTPAFEDQLRKGIEVEHEHTDDPEVAEQIARDHLEELPDYYDRLAEMEGAAGS